MFDRQLFREGFIQTGLLFLFALFLLLSSALSAEYSLQFRANNLAVYAEEQISSSQQAAFKRLDLRIDDLQAKFGIYLDIPAPIYLIKDKVSYNKLAVGKAKIVEFSDAFYSGANQHIYIRPLAEIEESYLKTLLHEYIHWYLENIFVQAPLWFHEGMATQYSGQMGFERYVYFLQQSFWGRSSDLFRMSYAYPERQEDWQIFYLSSSMAVRFMSERKQAQWDRFWTTVARVHRQNDKAVFSECFASAYRTSLYDFHREFAAYTKRLRYQYLFWGINSLLALLLPVILILGFRARRKRMALLPDLPEPEDEIIEATEEPEEETKA